MFYMKLFLASTVKHPNVVQAMTEYVKGFENKHMVYIPTAAHAQEGFGVYKTGGTFTLMKSLSPDLEILELEYINSEQAKKVIAKADILFMAGGFPVYLSYWLHRHDLKNFIKNRVNEGMFYIGTSAGAMVCGTTLAGLEMYGEPFARVVPGLRYVNYEIWPHYLDEHKELIEKDYSDFNIKPLRDGEYLLEDVS